MTKIRDSLKASIFTDNVEQSSTSGNKTQGDSVLLENQAAQVND